MHFAVSFDPLYLLGSMLLGYIAGLIGNVLGTIIVAACTSSLDGERYYKIGFMLRAIGDMQVVKIMIAFIAAAVTMALCSTTGTACVWTMGITGVIGLAFTLIYGFNMRI